MASGRFYYHHQKKMAARNGGGPKGWSPEMMTARNEIARESRRRKLQRYFLSDMLQGRQDYICLGRAASHLFTERVWRAMRRSWGWGEGLPGDISFTGLRVQDDEERPCSGQIAIGRSIGIVDSLEIFAIDQALDPLLDHVQIGHEPTR